MVGQDEWKNSIKAQKNSAHKESGKLHFPKFGQSTGLFWWNWSKNQSHGDAVNKAIPRVCHDSGTNHCELKCPGDGYVSKATKMAAAIISHKVDESDKWKEYVLIEFLPGKNHSVWSGWWRCGCWWWPILVKMMVDLFSETALLADENEVVVMSTINSYRALFVSVKQAACSKQWNKHSCFSLDLYPFFNQS